MNKKSELRLKAKELRKQLNIQEISKKIVANIRQNKFYKNAQNILLFYPMKNEIDLRELLSDKKNFYLPKIDGENLLICPFNKNDKLEQSSYKTFEPCSSPIDSPILDLIFVPALMVDKNNYRLGYGGGFYDRFLSKFPNITTICPIPQELCVETLPYEPHDIKINYIIMENSKRSVH